MSIVIHDRLFIECKLRKKHSAVSLWDEVKALADREGSVNARAVTRAGARRRRRGESPGRSGRPGRSQTKRAMKDAESL